MGGCRCRQRPTGTFIPPDDKDRAVTWRCTPEDTKSELIKQKIKTREWVKQSHSRRAKSTLKLWILLSTVGLLKSTTIHSERKSLQEPISWQKAIRNFKWTSYCNKGTYFISFISIWQHIIESILYFLSYNYAVLSSYLMLFYYYHYYYLEVYSRLSCFQMIQRRNLWWWLRS